MTKRYSVEQVANMLQCETEKVRTAIAELKGRQELSGETFPFAEAAWRIAPSDVIKIQLIVKDAVSAAEPPRRRKIIKRRT